MSEYQDCMTKAMREFPKGISREERGQLFCSHAKLCSGKASTLTEAEKICAEAPKTAPAGGTRKRRAKFNPSAMARCLVDRLHESYDKVGDISEEGLLIHINECSAATTKKSTYKRFMNSCVKEQGVAKDLPQNLRFIKLCEARWREQNRVQSG